MGDKLLAWVKANLPMALLLVIATAGVTFGLTNFLYVAPSDREVEHLQRENASLKEALKEAQATAARPAPEPENPVALPETGVAEGTSVTTGDGRLSIHVKMAIGNSVRLLTTLDSAKSVEQMIASIGDRLTIEAADKVYYIDLRRVRGGIVDLSVAQRRK